MKGIAEKRKVRADFDPKQSISVDVSGCTEEEKKEVQQAFFDVGIAWFSGSIVRESEVASFQYLGAVIYSNNTPEGAWYDHLMYGILPRTDSISPQQFFSMVYEAEQQGHIHADLMAQYAEDAKTTDKPWELWEFKSGALGWFDCKFSPAWNTYYQYRRTPKTHIVSGVEVPDLRITPEVGDRYYLASPTETMFTFNHKAELGGYYSMWAERGLCYEHTEAGKQAAILHAKAWLGIA